MTFNFSSNFESLTSVYQNNTWQASEGDIFMYQESIPWYGLRSARNAGAKAWSNQTFLFKQSISIDHHFAP